MSNNSLSFDRLLATIEKVASSTSPFGDRYANKVELLHLLGEDYLKVKANLKQQPPLGILVVLKFTERIHVVKVPGLIFQDRDTVICTVQEGRDNRHEQTYCLDFLAGTVGCVTKWTHTHITLVPYLPTSNQFFPQFKIITRADRVGFTLPDKVRQNVLLSRNKFVWDTGRWKSNFDFIEHVKNLDERLAE